MKSPKYLKCNANTSVKKIVVLREFVSRTRMYEFLNAYSQAQKLHVQVIYIILLPAHRASKNEDSRSYRVYAQKVLLTGSQMQGC
jgi:hypothetical protein